MMDRIELPLVFATVGLVGLSGLAVLMGAALGLAKQGLAETRAITEFPIPTASTAPFGITTGPDGALASIRMAAARYRSFSSCCLARCSGPMLFGSRSL